MDPITMQRSSDLKTFTSERPAALRMTNRKQSKAADEGVRATRAKSSLIVNLTEFCQGVFGARN